MTDVGAMAQSVYQYLLDLLQNPDDKEAFEADPEGELARHGLEGATGEDVYDAVQMMCGQLPTDACQNMTENYLQPVASGNTINSGATSNINVTQGGAPPPPPLQPGPGETGLTAAAHQISYVTNNYTEITNTTVDNSINQIVGGDLNQAIAQGEGSIANTGMMEGAFNTGEFTGVQAGGDVQGAAVGDDNTVIGGNVQDAAVIGGDAGNVNVGGNQANVAAGDDANVNFGGNQNVIDAQDSAVAVGGDATNIDDSNLENVAFGEGDVTDVDVTGGAGQTQVAVGDFNQQQAQQQNVGNTGGEGQEPGYEPEPDYQPDYEPPADGGDGYDYGGDEPADTGASEPADTGGEPAEPMEPMA